MKQRTHEMDQVMERNLHLHISNVLNVCAKERQKFSEIKRLWFLTEVRLWVLCSNFCWNSLLASDYNHWVVSLLIEVKSQNAIWQQEAACYSFWSKYAGGLTSNTNTQRVESEVSSSLWLRVLVPFCSNFWPILDFNDILISLTMFLWADFTSAVMS